MKSEKIFSPQDALWRWLATAVACSLILAMGCIPAAEKPAKIRPEPEKRILKPAKAKAVTLALKFIPQDSTTYKHTRQTVDSIKFEGFWPNKSEFRDKSNRGNIEMTFTQQIQSVNDKGNAIAKITIKELKCTYIHKNKTVLDFDSSREEDLKKPFAKLIGQSYTIEITPAGRVLRVIDVSQVKASAQRVPMLAKTAMALFKPDVIKERHKLALPATDKNQLRTGDNWSSLKSFNFGLMGSNSYEKIYTLKEVKDTDKQQIALVEMSAIPTSEMAEQQQKKQAISGLLDMFDTTETYTGQLKFDLTTGKVEKYLEELNSECIAIDPEAKQKDDKEPAALKIIIVRLYKLEKID